MGCSFGSSAWVSRSEAIEIAGFEIRQQYPARRSLIAMLRVRPLRLLAHAEIPDMFFLPAPVASEGAIHKTQAQYGAGGTRKQLWIDN